MISTCRVVTFCICFLSCATAFAQNGTLIRFRNTLDTRIELILTNNVDGQETTLPIAQNAVGVFSIPEGSSLFDIRVMPLDNIQTGFRFDGRNLLNVANNSKGRAVPVGGIVQQKCYYYRSNRCFFQRWFTVCYKNRIGAFINEVDSSGNIQRIEAPVEPY